MNVGKIMNDKKYDIITLKGSKTIWVGTILKEEKNGCIDHKGTWIPYYIIGASQCLWILFQPLNWPKNKAFNIRKDLILKHENR